MESSDICVGVKQSRFTVTRIESPIKPVPRISNDLSPLNYSLTFPPRSALKRRKKFRPVVSTVYALREEDVEGKVKEKKKKKKKSKAKDVMPLGSDLDLGELFNLHMGGDGGAQETITRFVETF
jgi:MoxR-like ATPase